jgi:hypothetical protein
MTVATWVLPAWGHKAVTEARLARSRERRRRSLALALALVPFALAGSLWGALSALLPAPVATRGGVSLWRTQSGLLLAAPFDDAAPLRDLGDTFAFGGSAAAGVGYAVARPGGLSVGVRRHPRRFEGWFAVTRSAFPVSGVYHVEMAKPEGAVRSKDAQGEAVFAVQTGTTKVSGLINYVVVASNSHGGGTTWSVGYAAGHLADAKLTRFLRVPVRSTSPDTRAVTVQTNGRSQLAVWFGTRLVFASDHLHLDIAPPFQAYLEVQSRLVPYASSFRDFWVVGASSVAISAPDGAHVQLVTTGGKTLAAAVAHHGTARLVLPPPRARGTAELVARLGGRSVRLGPFAYAGGDRYRITGLRS